MKKLRLLRNIGIAAHIDAGKTTLTERILYYSGKIHKIGETHSGNSQMDTSKQERAKGITISAAATQIQWQWNHEPYTINIIDTPGHVDFTIEVERALRVLDGLVVLFDSVSGVEPQSETVWQQANRYKVPRMAFVNKMDKSGADFEKVVRQMNDTFQIIAIPLQIPIGAGDDFVGVIDLITMQALFWENDAEQPSMQPIPNALLESAQIARQLLLETLAEYDDTLLEQYLENADSISVETIQQAIRQATLDRNIVPVMLGAAYRNKGVQPLLNAVAQYLPSPNDVETLLGTNIETDEMITIEPTATAPFIALAFKVILDEQNRKLTFIRVYAGQLSIGDSILNSRTGQKQRISHLYQIHATKKERIKTVEAGQIVAITGVKKVRTGDTLTAMDFPVALESLFIPAPVIGIAIEASSNKDLDKLGLALNKLMEEDPTFSVEVNPETGQTIIRGMGELHLEIIVLRLRDDFGIELNTGQPEVTYREVITQTVRHRERLKKFTGGPGLFAEIEVEISPADKEFLESDAFMKEQKRLQFVNEITGGVIPKEYIPSVEKGFKAMMDSGTLANYPLEHLKVRLLDGKTHSNESKPLAFELVARDAFKAAIPLATPQLLEPVMAVTVTTPDQYLGKIIGDLNRRRAIITEQHNERKRIVVKATVPLAEMFGYVSQLRSLSAGRAIYSMLFEKYAPVTSAVLAEVLA